MAETVSLDKKSLAAGRLAVPSSTEADKELSPRGERKEVGELGVRVGGPLHGMREGTIPFGVEGSLDLDTVQVFDHPVFLGLGAEGQLAFDGFATQFRGLATGSATAEVASIPEHNLSFELRGKAKLGLAVTDHFRTQADLIGGLGAEVTTVVGQNLAVGVGAEAEAGPFGLEGSGFLSLKWRPGGTTEVDAQQLDDDGYVEAQLRVALAELRTGEAQDAVNAEKRLHTAFALLQMSHPGLVDETALEVGGALIASGHTELAATMMQGLTEPETKTMAADLFAQASFQSMLAHRPEDAVRHSKQALRMVPDHAQAWHLQGLAHLDLEKPELAREALNRAAEIGERARRSVETGASQDSAFLQRQIQAGNAAQTMAQKLD